jgi:hypothetical protein
MLPYFLVHNLLIFVIVIGSVFILILGLGLFIFGFIDTKRQISSAKGYSSLHLISTIIILGIILNYLIVLLFQSLVISTIISGMLSFAGFLIYLRKYLIIIPQLDADIKEDKNNLKKKWGGIFFYDSTAKRVLFHFSKGQKFNTIRACSEKTANTNNPR